MTPENNWLNLFGKYTTDWTTWHAQTTVYSPEIEVIKAYKFTRQFSTNQDKTIVYHQNKYYLPDGSFKEQSWEIDKENCNHSDGIIHPEAKNMRAISFGNGMSIWVSKEFTIDKNFGSEVFLKQGNSRYGLISVYENGNLAKFVLIKENSDDFPEEIDNEIIKTLGGKWRIKQIKIKPNLEDVEEELITENIDFYLNSQDNKIYNLPEKVRFNIPEKIFTQQEFTLNVGQEISDNLYQQVTVNYDLQGKLKLLTSSQFEKIKE